MNKFVSEKSSLLKKCSLSVLALALAPAVAHASYFMQPTGITGSSKAVSHAKWIDIDTFSWGVSAPSRIVSGSGSGAGKASFSDFSWTQALDMSFGPMFSDLANGKTIPKVVVDLQSSGSKPVVYFEMTFGNVLVTSLTQSGSGGNPSVTGSFSYGTIRLDYWGLNANGTRGTNSFAMFDVAKNTGSISSLAAIYAQGLEGPTIADAVPEPESYAMLLAGLGLMGAVARRRKSRQG